MKPEEIPVWDQTAEAWGQILVLTRAGSIAWSGSRASLGLSFPVCKTRVVRVAPARTIRKTS